jgi:hypothetical protein
MNRPVSRDFPQWKGMIAIEQQGGKLPVPRLYLHFHIAAVIHPLNANKTRGRTVFPFEQNLSALICGHSLTPMTQRMQRVRVAVRPAGDEGAGNFPKRLPDLFDWSDFV